MLKDAAMYWVKMNCPSAKLQSDVSKTIDMAAAERVHCWIGIGAAMTRSGEPFLVHFFAGEVFIFQLTAAQAAALKIRPAGIKANVDAVPEPVVHSAPPVASLERLEIDGMTVDPSAPIRGKLQYDVSAGHSLLCSVHLDYDFPGCREARFHDLPIPLSGKGVIDIEFSPLDDSPKGKVEYRGPVVLFARLSAPVSTTQPWLLQQLSTTCAALVDLV